MDESVGPAAPSRGATTQHHHESRTRRTQHNTPGGGSGVSVNAEDVGPVLTRRQQHHQQHQGNGQLDGSEREAYNVICDNFRLLRRKYDALSKAHNELLWDSAVLKAAGLSEWVPAVDEKLHESPSRVSEIELLKVIGRGNFSSVFLGQWPSKQKCAVKRISKAATKALPDIRNIATEHEALKTLSRGPCVLGLHCSFASQNHIYFVMEFFGEELYAYLKRHRDGLPAQFGVAVIHGVSNGLAFMHDLCFAHRDIKPENVLVHVTGDRFSDIIVKLCDLGLCAKLEPDDGPISGPISCVPTTPPVVDQGSARGATDDADSSATPRAGHDDRGTASSTLSAATAAIESRSLLSDAGQLPGVAETAAETPASDRRFKPLFKCCGSMGFFAPEMLDSRGYSGAAADVWSLGCLGLEVVSGNAFFEAFWFWKYTSFFKQHGRGATYHHFQAWMRRPSDELAAFLAKCGDAERRVAASKNTAVLERHSFQSAVPGPCVSSSKPRIQNAPGVVDDDRGASTRAPDQVPAASSGTRPSGESVGPRPRSPSAEEEDEKQPLERQSSQRRHTFPMADADEAPDEQDALLRGASPEQRARLAANWRVLSIVASCLRLESTHRPQAFEVRDMLGAVHYSDPGALKSAVADLAPELRRDVTPRDGYLAAGSTAAAEGGSSSDDCQNGADQLPTRAEAKSHATPASGVLQSLKAQLRRSLGAKPDETRTEDDRLARSSGHEVAEKKALTRSGSGPFQSKAKSTRRVGVAPGDATPASPQPPARMVSLTIGVASSPHSPGSTRKIRSPTSPQSSDEAKANESHESFARALSDFSATRQRGKVLVVDDSSVALHWICKAIESKYNCEVHTASSAIEALSLTEHNDYDAVLTDMIMPHMDGFQLVSALRAREKKKRDRDPYGHHKRLFICALTQLAEAFDVQNSADVDAVSRKPFGKALQLDFLSDYLERREGT